MGVGDSLEASYALAGPLPAGRWGLVGDGILTGDGTTRVEVRFQILLRRKGGPAGSGEPVVQFLNTFRRDPANRFGAVRYDGEAQGAAVAAEPGDRLVLRLTGLGGDPPATAYYILNGDGARSGGRIPRVDLPR